MKPQQKLPTVLKHFLFIVPTLGSAPLARAVQEPPFARPAHEEVIPLARKGLPNGHFQFLPMDLRPTLSAGLSSSEPALALPDKIDAFVATPPAGRPVTTSDDVGLTLTVTKPSGCYRTAVDIKAIDAWQHLVTVNLIGAEDEPCVAEHKQERVDVNLGFFVAGEHGIVIGDGASTQTTLTLTVTQAARALAE